MHHFRTLSLKLLKIYHRNKVVFRREEKRCQEFENIDLMNQPHFQTPVRVRIDIHWDHDQ